MGQATHAIFPLANILRRVSGLAHFPEMQKADEPFLDEVMSDPIIQQMMAADNLDDRDVRLTIARAQTRLHHH
ncbi:MAG: hypothetical protein H8E36_11500 [Rhodospirillaceae bacterium]|nr:hypothetical protein [Rhodospirillaceae bacterium]MBL6930237.1 hypothetical protein [Rhodospirillales bacterium]